MSLVDEIISDWAAERPDIDCSGKAVVCRILRYYSTVIASLEKSLKSLGITPNIFSVLVTIRRKGPHAEVVVKKMMQEVLVTSGAMSNLLNKLVDLGLITKRKGTEEEDERSAFIKLTPKGLAIVDQAMEVQAACECKLTQALTKSEKKAALKIITKTATRGGGLCRKLVMNNSY